jgi:hypothetical protein
MAEEYLALQILADERNAIAYRPKLAMFLGSVTAAILLQQVFYRFSHSDNQPFYKFRDECEHKLYKRGDSWCEELGFSPKQFDTALDVIGTKITKGANKAETMAHEVTSDVFPDDSIAYLVVYWTDSNRITWYWLNRDLLGKCLKFIYLVKSTKGDYLEPPKRANTSIPKSTSEITKEKIASQLSEQAQAILDVFNEAQKGYSVDREPHYIEDAEWLALNCTPANVTAFMTTKRKDKFWAMQIMKLQYIRQNITVWLEANKSPMPTPPTLAPAPASQPALTPAEIDARKAQGANVRRQLLTGGTS